MTNDLLSRFNKAFESKARLSIMSVLMVNDAVSFNELKELLSLTDGNLATHLRALEEQGYVLVQKQFVGRKPNTTYAATDAGRHAFTDHLNALESFIRGTG
jgi:DNA-binding HxlR family transcriptional regulator